MHACSTHPRHPRRFHGRGFSLLELLVALAVLGVTSAIALPAVSTMHQNASEARAKRQARDIASVFNAGRTAGAFASAMDVASAMNAVGAGACGTGGLTSSEFIVPGVSSTMNAFEPQTQRPSFYLSWQGGCLVYDEEGAVASYQDLDGSLRAAGEAALAQARSSSGGYDSPAALAE